MAATASPISTKLGTSPATPPSSRYQESLYMKQAPPIESARDRPHAGGGAQHDPGQSAAGAASGIAWPVPATTFSNSDCSRGAARRRACADAASGLGNAGARAQRAGVSLMVLWEEY